MIDIGKHVDYYSVFCPIYDANTNDLNLLEEIRYNFLKNKKRQKNKIVKELGGKTYRYSYLLEDGKPAKWKKMLNDKLIERSRTNQDNSYSILIQDENKNLNKILYFDSEHNWQKSEYFRNKAKISFSKSKNNEKILVSEYKNNDVDVASYELFPFELNENEYKLEALDSSLTSLFCKTNFGDVNYFTKQQIEILNGLKKVTENNNITENKTNCTENRILGNCENNITLKNEDVEQNTQLEVDNLGNNCFQVSGKSQFVCYSQDSSCPYSKTYGKTIQTENGNTYFYFGDMHDNLRNGQGRTVTESGLPAYEGFYKNDKKDGFGSFYYKSGKPYYIGEFKENTKHGFGILFSQDGKTINIGAFEKDKPQNLISVFKDDVNLLFTEKDNDDTTKRTGFVCHLKDKKVSIESFDNGKPTGKKTQFDESGKLLYSGDFDGDFKSGFGIEYNADGTLRYKGNWKNDKYEGQGVLYFEDGRKIEGNFEDGKVEGFACEYDGRLKKIYEGNWKDNLYNEEGTKFLNNGNYLKGLFEAGLAQGVLLEFNANGDVIYKGNFNEDAYYGEGSLYVNGEKIYEGSFENNTYNGFGCMYENAICVYEGQFENGARSGFGTSFRDDEIQYVGNWREDRYDGIGMIYEQSKPKYAGSFLKGKKEGRINEIYQGKVIKECIFESDDLVYAREYAYPNMNIVFDGNIHNGKRCGMGCLFTEYGEKEAEGIFANDEIVTRMRIFLKNLLPLPECTNLQNTEYESFRFGPLYVIEKDFLGGIYSGLLKEDKPQGKGTILYSDHRYTGDFIEGVSKGSGIIYKNDGTQICGKFFESDVLGSTLINFESGRSYYFMSNT
ncbi:MAG: hypothetical protein RUMPE_00691 [Eubacteriales bacterium SKADARSKE-1]|nr:hypothetical protein [Eubacteriales bacterium SKADARSKE-1]